MMSLANEQSVLRKVAIVMLVITTITGCTTTQRVPTSYATIAWNEVKVGDRVEVIRINGRTLRFTVTQISQSGVTGSMPDAMFKTNHFVAYRDMLDLRVRKDDPGDAWMEFAGVVGIALLTVTLLKGLSAARPAL